MHSELPWNVAGIPPEAREAARAAARREGLSVGEWMTRRIIRGFPGASVEENSSWRTPVESPAPTPEPAASTSARDTEEMLARVSRSESESQNAYKAIDQQMKSVSRRLEDAERNQTENSRAMTQAATQINIAAREQAQAFEQMSADVTALTERLVRVERHAANDGMRDAVKALHQGLSRVADQIASTASQSAEQIAALAGNMDSLATQVVETRERTEAAAQAVETHFTSLDERLRVVERTAFSSASAIDHTMENVETLKASNETIESDSRRHGAAIAQMKDVFDHLNARIAAAEQQSGTIEHLQASISAVETSISTVEASVSTVQANVANVEASLANVDASISHVETSLSAVESTVYSVKASAARTDAAIADLQAQDQAAPLDHRLQGIEHVLSDIMSRLEYSERNSASQTGTVEQTLRELSAGFEAADRRNRETINDLQQALQHTAVKIAAVEEKAIAPVPPPAATAEPAAAPAEPAQPIFDAPPFAEHLVSPEPEALDFAPPPFAAEHDGAQDDLPPAFGEPFAEAVPPFADEPMDGEPESFLAAARRSAQAAAARPEQPAPRASMGGFAWTLSGKNGASGDTERKRLVVGGSIFGVAVAAALTGVVLTRGVGAPQPETTAPTTSVSSPLAAPPSLTPSAEETSGNAQPQTAAGDDESTPVSNPQPAVAQQTAPTPQSTAEPKPRHVHAAAASPVATPQTDAAQTPSFPLQKLASLANTGDSRSQLLLGLKYLEGSGTAVNEVEAARWLSRSAQQGEPMAQYRLGTLYERGRGVAADPRQASHWYELAAKQGNRKAMHNLAVAFAEGSGEPKDPVSAAMWFSRAANLGLADSQFNLAVLYERGMGVKQSLVDAYKWYLVAAAQGDAESKTRADALSTQLNDADRSAAQQAATAFHPERPNPAANSIPVLG